MAAGPQVPPHDPATTTVYISFSAEINPNTTESLLAAFMGQINQGYRNFYLMLSSPGGVVMNGLNVYNVLRGLPINLTTHNVGNVDSIGNAVFLAGATRIACPHSTFMFHGVSFNANPGQNFDERAMRERLASVLSDQKRIGSIIQDRSTLPISKIRAMFRETRTIDATEAIGAGIVHQVEDVQIPAGAPVYQLVFQR
jgi:ATP-dependent protease ClpP protease subunit